MSSCTGPKPSALRRSAFAAWHCSSTQPRPRAGPGRCAACRALAATHLSKNSQYEYFCLSRASGMKALASQPPRRASPVVPATACVLPTGRLSHSRALPSARTRPEQLRPAPERRKHVDSPSFRRAPQRDETPPRRTSATRRPPQPRRPHARPASATSET